MKTFVVAPYMTILLLSSPDNPKPRMLLAVSYIRLPQDKRALSLLLCCAQDTRLLSLPSAGSARGQSPLLLVQMTCCDSTSPFCFLNLDLNRDDVYPDLHVACWELEMLVTPWPQKTPENLSIFHFSTPTLAPSPTLHVSSCCLASLSWRQNDNNKWEHLPQVWCACPGPSVLPRFAEQSWLTPELLSENNHISANASKLRQVFVRVTKL